MVAVLGGVLAEGIVLLLWVLLELLLEGCSCSLRGAAAGAGAGVVKGANGRLLNGSGSCASRISSFLLLPPFQRWAGSRGTRGWTMGTSCHGYASSGQGCDRGALCVGCLGSPQRCRCCCCTMLWPGLQQNPPPQPSPEHLVRAVRA